MNTQVVAVLFSVLLCSTFALEYHHARHLQEHLKSQHHSKSAHKLREASEQCEVICNTNGLQIIYNKTLNIFAVFHFQANVAIVFDIEAGLVAVFNGATGVAVVLNLKAQTGVYFAAGVSTAVWIAAKISFEAYFNALTGLQFLFDLHVGVSFTFAAITEAILKEIKAIIIHFGVEIEANIELELKKALTILVSISNDLSVALKGSFKLFLAGLGAGLVVIHGDLLWLVNVCKGLVAFFAQIKGGIEALIAAKVEFDLVVLFKIKSGLELLTYLLVQIAKKVELSVVIIGFASIEIFLAICVSLGGYLTTGLNGAFLVLYKLLLYIKGHISISALFNVVLRFCAHNSVSIDFSAAFTAFLAVVQSCPAFKIAADFIVNLQAGKLLIGGIDIGAIFKILCKGALEGALFLAVVIILQCSAFIKVAESIPLLCLHLFALINNKVGLHLIVELGIKVEEKILSASSGFVAIFASINIFTLITGGFSINAFLSSLPVFGDIYAAISAALKANGSFDLSVLLNGSIYVINVIKAVVGNFFHISLGGSGSLPNITDGLADSDQGSIAINYGGSITIGGGISISGSGSGSGSESSTSSSVTVSGSGSVTNTGSGSVTISGSGSGSGSGSVTSSTNSSGSISLGGSGSGSFSGGSSGGSSGGISF